MTKRKAEIDWNKTINWDVVDKNADVLLQMFERAEARQAQTSAQEESYDRLPKVDEQKLKDSIVKIIQK